MKKISRKAVEARTEEFVPRAQDVIESFLSKEPVHCSQCGEPGECCGLPLVDYPKTPLVFKAALEVMKMAGHGPINRRREEQPLEGDPLEALLRALEDQEPSVQQQIVARLTERLEPSEVIQ